MLPSNTVLARNIDYLLHRYKFQHEGIQEVPPVFSAPPSQLKANSNLLRLPVCPMRKSPQRRMVLDRVRMLNNYSRNKIKSMKGRRLSECTIEPLDNKVNRYNMSIDKVIELPIRASKTRQAKSKGQGKSYNDTLLRRTVRGSLMPVGTRSKAEYSNEQTSHFQSINQNQQFDCKLQRNNTNNFRKKSTEGRRVPLRQISPDEQHIISKFIRVNQTIPVHPKKQTLQEHLQKSEHSSSPQLKLQSQNYSEFQPRLHVCSQESSPRRRPFLRSVNCKQVYLNKALKSKTQMLRREERISPWERFQQIAQQNQQFM